MTVEDAAVPAEQADDAWLTDWALQWYYAEIADLGNLVRLSAHRVNEPGADPRHVFADMQAMLSAIAMMSKYLWPHDDSPGYSRIRGARLRQEFGLDENSPLASRLMRNELEHMDERVDKVLRRTTLVGDKFIGGQDMVTVENSSEEFVRLRQLDPEKREFSLWNKTVDYQTLTDAALSLADAAAAKSSRM